MADIRLDSEISLKRAVENKLTPEEVVGFMEKPYLDQLAKHLQYYEKIANNESRLKNATTDTERKNIVTRLDKLRSRDPSTIVSEIRIAGGNSFANVFGREGKGPPYWEVVTDVAKKLKLEIDQSLSGPEFERALLEKQFTRSYSELSESEKKQLMEASERLAEEHGLSFGKEALAGGGLAIAGLSGFALFTAASTTLAGLAGLVGLTLPFAAYTTMSTLLAAATGPLGWMALGGAAAFKIASPNKKKTIPCVLLIAAYRGILENIAMDELTKPSAE